MIRMKTKILIPGALLMLLCATSQAQIPMTANTLVPDVGYYDQSYLPGTVAEGTNTINSPFSSATGSGNNDLYTYVSNPDRQSKAQSFTTGASPLGYTLKSFTFQQAYGVSNGWVNNGTYFLLTSGGSVKVRIGTLPGGPYSTGYTTILETNATYTGTTYNTGSQTSALGIYFNYDLTGAGLTLATNTTYFVEIMATGSDHWELNNTATNSFDTNNFPLIAAVYTNGAALRGNTTADLDRTGAFSGPPNGGEFAFVAQTPAVGAPLVVATARAAAAASGQTIKLTATITPGIGTVTNVSVNLRPIGLTNLAARLVLSNANVFTNSFTVTTNALLGATNLTVTAIQDTRPEIIGVGRAPFTVLSASAPQIAIDTTPTNFFTVYVGQGVRFSATFTGVQPIAYIWQVSGDSETWTDIPGATNSAYTIPSASLGDANLYYHLQATNLFGITVSTPTYMQVTEGTPLFTWSAPIPFAGLNANQILTNFPGTFVAGALVAQNGGTPITVSNSSGSTIVFAGSGTWAGLSGGTGYSTGANTNLTGNTNFDNCLNRMYTDNATHTITFSNLIVGQQYQVQLFALDDRSGLTPVAGNRYVNWQDPADATDTAQTYSMADNFYVLGTFTANNSVMTLQQNMLTATFNGNFNCLVLRSVGGTPLPYVTRQPANVGGFLGTNVSIIAGAAGDTTLASPTVTFQWQAGPVEGPFTNLVEGSKYAGTTAGTLTISNLVADDGVPVYQLVATGSAGSVTSIVAHVYVQALPVPPVAGSFGAYALSNNAVGFWQLNETNDPSSGFVTAYDFSGKGNNGTYRTAAKNAFNGILGPQPPTYPGFAANQGALETTAGTAASAVNLPPFSLNTNTAAITTNGVTIAMWIKPTAGQATFTGLFMYRNNTVEGFGFGGTQVGGMAGLGYTWNNNQAATYNFSSGLYPPVNVWSFVGVVITSNQATIFLDYVDPNTGQAVRLSAVNTRTHNTYTFTGGTTIIGNDTGAAGRTFAGDISDVGIYNTALSSDQILQLFGAGLSQQAFSPLVSFVPQDVFYPAPIAAGRGVTMTGIANGTLPLTNQWTFNGANLTDGAYLGATVSGSHTASLTVTNLTYDNAGSYQLLVTNAYGMTNTLVEKITILPSTLVGQWLSGTQSLADLSGYAPAGKHDATLQAGTVGWSDDVPSVAPPGSYSLAFTNAGLTVANSSTLDAGYTNTFDNQVNNGLTVMCWAKGWPGQWNPFVSKNGESVGWQLRQDGSQTPQTNACWTMRGSGGATQLGNGTTDMATRTIPTGSDGKWHHYVGTYSPVTGLRTLYVDGILAAQTTANTVYSLASPEHLMIGGRDAVPGNAFGNYFTGNLYDVRVYNYELPEEQVVSIAKGVPQTPATFVTAGSFAKFTTRGINAAPPYTGYQWQFNGANLTDGAYLGATVSGSGTINLAVSNITVANAGLYQLLVTNVAGVTTSSIASLTVQPTTMVGQWLSGSQTLTDVSSFTPGGAHDAGLQSGAVGWSTDVPASAPGGSYSLGFTNAGLIVSNSSTLDLAYTNTFDNQIANGMTVMCWAKGIPVGWSPFVSKWGENIYSWQLRVNNSSVPTWTIRGSGNGDMQGSKATDGNWHHYTGTYSLQTGVRTLYVDGVQVARQTGEGPYTLSDNSHLMIGARDNGGNSFGNQFNGKIYDVRVYNYALSQAQLGATVPGLTPSFTSRQFTTGTGGNASQLVLSWSFGTLLEATNAAGPWNTTTNVSPFTNNATLPADFFKVSNP
jgi:hypothetical protein